MPCELVHDWPSRSVGQGFTCCVCGAFISEDVVRTYDPEGDAWLVPSDVLDDAHAAQNKLGRKYVFP